jgi:hypothetical protein
MSETNKELVWRHFEELWNRREMAVTEEDTVAMLQLGVVQPPDRSPA